MRNGKRRITGDPMIFRGMVTTPINEMGVLVCFSQTCLDLGFFIVQIGPEFPDGIVRRANDSGWEELDVEFEYASLNFRDHGHDPTQCDLIICWKHNWIDCPLEVICLSDAIRNLSNTPITRPNRPF
jgi:hypothetical protein